MLTWTCLTRRYNRTPDPRRPSPRRIPHLSAISREGHRRSFQCWREVVNLDTTPIDAAVVVGKSTRESSSGHVDRLSELVFISGVELLGSGVFCLHSHSHYMTLTAILDLGSCTTKTSCIIRLWEL